MKVNILSNKLIKPSIPTPNDLRNFNISFTDEMSPASNVPLILYYPIPLSISNNVNGREPGSKESSSKLIHSKLESSLAQILPEFYPLAGRYIKESRLVDCGDQGVQYIQGQVDCPLAEILGRQIDPDQLNHLLPRSLGESDEFTDPMVSIKVSMFECGGFAIGASFAHRLVDISTATTFLTAWADASNIGSEQSNSRISPCFNSSLLFPGRNFPKLELGIPRNNNDNLVGGTNIVTRVFVLDGKAITSIKSNVANHFDDAPNRPLTRVRLVSGLILNALLRIDRANHGRSRPAFVIQTVNFRKKTCPPFPPYSCGNLCVFAKAKFSAQKINETVELKHSVDLIQDVLSETIGNCKNFLNSGEDGHMLMINPFKEVTETLQNNNGELNAILFNSWCSLPYYDADFGWGKPAWVGMANIPFSQSVVLINTKDGQGIEAWVSLDEDGMSMFTKDVDILQFAVGK